MKIKSNEEFIEKAEEMVRDYKDNVVGEEYDYDVYVVWFCKMLQNYKALLGTTLYDKLYFEVTYNGDKEEIYCDIYHKLDQISE